LNSEKELKLYEYELYCVVWEFRIGTIGDSDGRTWAKDLLVSERFPTKELAEAFRDNHPYLEKGRWGWKTKNYYGKFAIVRKLEKVKWQ
jgi:hypothetical protein